MRRPLQRPQGTSGQFLWDLLTSKRLLTGQVFHLVYWAGLGIIGIIAFGVLGAPASASPSATRSAGASCLPCGWSWASA